MNIIFSILLALSTYAQEAVVKNILPKSFRYEISPHQPEATIGANAIYDLEVNYFDATCGSKFKSLTANRLSDDQGNTIYMITLKLEIPVPAIAMYCPMEGTQKIQNINKGNLDINPKFYFEASM